MSSRSTGNEGKAVAPRSRASQAKAAGAAQEDEYFAFLRAKMAVAPERGFAVERSEVNPLLKPHQADIVLWAVRGGRRAVFAAFGLGKSVIQLEILRLVMLKMSEAGMPGHGRALLIAPLGVRQEFARDAAMLGTPLTFVRRTEEAVAGGPGLYLTNYESVRDGKLDPRLFDAVSLDEAACLRGMGGTKTFREFMARLAGDDRSGARTEGIPFRFVATATPSPNDFIELLAYSAFLGVMDVSQAKAQPLDAKVLTPAGWTTMGEIETGDLVIAGDGTPTRVLGVYPQGERPVYRVTFDDGSSTECDAEHLWLTRTQYERNNERRYRLRNPDGTRTFATVKTAADIARTLIAPGGSGTGANHDVPTVGPVEFPARAVPLDPWLLGFLLGDACLRETSVVISTGDPWIVGEVQAKLPKGLFLRRTTPDGCDYSVTGSGKQGGRGPGSNPLLAALRGMGLLGKRSWEKAIPAEYLYNSPTVRMALLRGLMDADGTVQRDGTMQSLTTTSPELAEGAVFLVRSLGGVAKVRALKTAGRPAYHVAVRMPNGVNPFSLPRKAERVKERTGRPARRFIVSVEPAGTKPVQCIAVEHADHLYVTDDFIVTHNTRFFRRNSEKADKLTLHGHKVDEFWLWVSTWAVFVQRPSDLGHSDEGYSLPPLRVEWHEIPADHSGAGKERDGQFRLLADAAVGVTEAAREKRRSLAARVAKMMELRALDPAAHRLLWHDLEDERHAIEAAIPGVTSVWGSQDLDAREAAVADFSEGRVPELAAKPVMLGSGCNLQRHCAWAIFLGIGFKFNDIIQAVHRIQRFLQTRPVRIDLIYTESERGVRKALEAKWRQHEELSERMGDIIRKYGLASSALQTALHRSIADGGERVEVTGERFTLVNNDTVLETRAMPDDSVHMILTSIPFSTQYEYTPSYNDFGHTDSNGHFWEQMGHLTPHLLRVLKPGRVTAIHVKDRIVPGGLTGLGFQTVYPFHADAIEHFQRHGFAYLGMKTIVTDVVRENNQTYRLGWSEQCKDGSRMGVGMPEYLLLFRKPPTDSSDGYADEPVVKDKAEYSRARWQTDAHGFARSCGDRLLTPEDLDGLPHDQIFRLFRHYSLSRVYDYEHHVRIGEHLEAKGSLPVTFMLLQPQSWHPDVWTDITRMLTLNGAQSAAGREMHLCPMQLDLANRAIVQHTMEGETVYDPFSGLGTVPMCAVKLHRRGLGTELNPRYFFDACQYLRAAEAEVSMPTLFDYLAEVEGGGEAGAAEEGARELVAA